MKLNVSRETFRDLVCFDIATCLSVQSKRKCVYCIFWL